MTTLMMRHVMAGLAILAVGAAVQGTHPSTRQAPATSGWLGLALSCTGCEGAGEGATGPLIVRAVAPGGPADRILSAGDTIVMVNRTITDARRMREALLSTPVDSALIFELRGARGNYTVQLRKRADRLRQVGTRALPLKYEGAYGGVGVEVLTPSAPVVSRDSTGALLIRIGEHAVRLRPADVAPR